MVKTLELTRFRNAEETAHAGLALELVPALLEEYLKLCGLAEFAPTGVGGTRRPYTNVMALFYEIHNLYVRRPMATGNRLMKSVMSSEAGVAARQKVAQMIAEQSFDTPKFRALLARSRRTGS